MKFNARYALLFLALISVLAGPFARSQEKPQPTPPTEAELELPPPPEPVEGQPMPPPPQVPARKAPRAFGDSFSANGDGGTEPPINEARPLINGGACQPDSIEFDPCPNSWFFLPPKTPQVPNPKNAFGLTEDDIKERDHILSLAALAVVNEDWQFAPAIAATRPEVAGLPRRGHNIGGVLVDERGKLVWWERNSNGMECNGTAHGETRMLQSYLKFARRSTLGCHSVYTSLEPCAMCSGMMVQTKIARTVYVEKDHGFGAAIERLHQPFLGRQFQCGFPRAPFSKHAEDVPASRKLDLAFHKFMKETGADDLTAFLQTKDARDIYIEAVNELIAFKARPLNEPVLADAKKLLLDLKSPIYLRAYVTLEEHALIERGRRMGAARMEKRAGLPLEIDPCCRPPLMDNSGRFGGNATSPACKIDAQPVTPVPVPATLEAAK